jgi:Protein of unknown function (DUF2637)
MSGTDEVIRWSTAVAVLGVAAVAAVASYEHACDLVRAHGESGGTARVVPLTVIYASSMVMLDSARWKRSVPALARWLLGLGIATTLATNVAHGLGQGPVSAAIAAWPTVALVGSYELLMMVIRGSQAVPDTVSGSGNNPDPLSEQAAEIFADQLAADRVTSVRAIRAAPRWPTPGAAAAGVPRYGSWESGQIIPLHEQHAGIGIKPWLRLVEQLPARTWPPDRCTLPLQCRSGPPSAPI